MGKDLLDPFGWKLCWRSPEKNGKRSPRRLRAMLVPVRLQRLVLLWASTISQFSAVVVQTDEWRGYTQYHRLPVCKWMFFRRSSKGIVHFNTIESAFSHLKRKARYLSFLVRQVTPMTLRSSSRSCNTWVEHGIFLSFIPEMGLTRHWRRTLSRASLSDRSLRCRAIGAASHHQCCLLTNACRSTRMLAGVPKIPIIGVERCSRANAIALKISTADSGLVRCERRPTWKNSWRRKGS